MKLYVGNLPFSATEEDLANWFSDHGFAVDRITVIRAIGIPASSISRFVFACPGHKRIHAGQRASP